MKSILVFVTSGNDNALGENIIKLPMLRALRTAFPEARITWVPGVGKGYFTGRMWPLVQDEVAEVITDLRLERSLRAAMLGRRPLAGRRFDLVVDVQKHLYLNLQLRRIPHRRFVSSVWRYWASEARPPRDFAPYAETRQLAIRLLGLAAAAAGRTIIPSPQWPVAEEWHERARSLLPPGDVYVGFAPGAGNKANDKMWPRPKFIELARRQAALGRRPVFFLGPDEETWLPEFRSAVPEALFPEWEDWVRKAGATDIRLAIALAGRLSAALSNCSGTGHLLAAGGAPMVSLYGPTNPAKYAPYAVANAIIRSADFGGTAEMEAIPVEAVCAGIEQVFTRR
jgi:ADP-heptose:LPS heptosyltransferase